jgi:hypothetical protein
MTSRTQIRMLLAILIVQLLLTALALSWVAVEGADWLWTGLTVLSSAGAITTMTWIRLLQREAKHEL